MKALAACTQTQETCRKQECRVHYVTLEEVWVGARWWKFVDGECVASGEYGKRPWTYPGDPAM